MLLYGKGEKIIIIIIVKKKGKGKGNGKPKSLGFLIEWKLGLEGRSKGFLWLQHKRQIPLLSN